MNAKNAGKVINITKHAHLQTNHQSFQNNKHTISVGVAYTRYPLSSHFECNNVWK